MATASTAPPTIDSTISGILKNGRAMGTISQPPKNAAPYAAASAATRTSWRTKPSRQPCTTSNKIKMTANETKTACQRGEPATDGIADCGLAIADRGTLGISKLTAPPSAVRDPQLQLLFAAARDRKARWPPSLRRLAPPEEEHTDHDVRAPRA